MARVLYSMQLLVLLCNRQIEFSAIENSKTLRSICYSLAVMNYVENIVIA